MRRATHVETEAFRDELERWIGIDEAAALIDAKGVTYGFHSVEQGRLKIWREAFRAIEFARKVGASKLRMQDAPDVALKIGDREVEVELTEARSEGALRNEDWRHYAELEAIGAKLPLQHYDPTGECLTVGHSVYQAITRKVHKPYAKSSVLAVRADCFWFPSLEEEMAASIEEAMAIHRSSFAAIWVLAGERFFRS